MIRVQLYNTLKWEPGDIHRLCICFSDWAVDIMSKRSLIFMKNGGTTSLEANVKTYNGTINSVTPDVIIVRRRIV